MGRARHDYGHCHDHGRGDFYACPHTLTLAMTQIVLVMRMVCIRLP